MKGTFFQKPIEYKIEVEGETWSQGDVVKGQLIVNNHGDSSLDFTSIGCHLCFVDMKKMKAKNDKAFSFIDSSLFRESAENTLDFSFKLKENCPITETASSLYILCGNKDKPFEGGLLQLNITPTKTILGFIETFENFFRFKFKALKNKKEFIEAKVIAPSSKEWSNIQQINLKMRMEGDELALNFLFKLKKISYENSVMVTKDVKREIEKVLSAKEHTMYGTPNQDGIMKAITEVLEQVKLKPLV